MKANERRRFGRQSCRLRVRFGSPQQLREQVIINIGDGGVFVETLYPLPIGSRVDLEMLVGEEPTPLKVRGEVTWMRDPSEGRMPGMGIRFVEISPKTQERLNQFLKPPTPSSGD